MRNKRIYKSFIIPLFLLFILSITLGFIGDDKRGNRVDKVQSVSSTNQTGKVGDAFRFNINNLNIPINRVGVIAAVNIPPDGSLGRFGNDAFLFSSGFIMTGYTSGNLWGFAQATASLIENMTPGTVASGPNDPDAQMYVVRREDPPFSQSWQDWKIAVDKFGADFYDGDGDGVYNPVDKNGNGQWDPDEDHPDLIGDVTAWCVYTDGIPAAQRLRFPGIAPQGVEIRQTVFAFASKGALGNIMFIRYRISNSGLVADQLDSVYFSVWADPDLGDFEDDLVGVDVSRNAGFVYNSGPDAQYGVQVPCFMIDFFSGPADYIAGETYIDVNGNGVYDDGVDTPLDTAFTNRGQILGIEILPGARNLDISSFVHYQQSDPTRGDPNNEFQARFYSLGELPLGGILDPCTDPIGQVRGGVDCSTIDPRFWYSGDPVAGVDGVGWINTRPTDQRQMTNVGPFNLKVGEEREITVAYVVGQGTNALNSITVARAIDDGAQFIFDNNFKAPNPPPAIVPEVVSGPDFIDFIFNAKDQVTYQDITDAWDNRFHGINVYAYRTNSTQDNVGGTENSMLYTSYQVDNFIVNVLKENPETGGREMLYPEAPQKLNPQVFADPNRANIRVRVTRDPFTGSALVKGKPYYFAFTSTAINYDALAPMDGSVTFGTPGDYFLSAAGFVSEVENVPRITRVVLGEDIYSPPTPPVDGNKLPGGGSSGKLQYDVVDKEALTGNSYQVTFSIDSAARPYAAKWDLVNTTTNTTLLQGSKDYLFGSPVISVAVTDGFIAKLSDEAPDLADEVQVETTNDWATANFYYLAEDMGDDSKRLPGGGPTAFTSLTNKYTKADKLRRVELRFDTPGKAYRYLNGFVGAAPPFRRSSYVYAEGVVAGAPGLTDPILAEIGQVGVGFVDVPFTAWVEDEAFGEMRQLAVGFIERRSTEGGNPDGVWDPGTNVNNTGEYIFIFNSTYDPNGGQQVYKGNYPGASTEVWADIKGYTIPSDATAGEVDRAIASSPFFDVLYAVGISKKDSATFFSATDKFIIEVENYPYTPEDVFEFQTRQAGTLTAEEEKALFDKVTVFPNPLYGFNVATSYSGGAADEPFVTFSNLPPDDITIKVYSLSGQLLRTLGASDRSSLSSPFLRWDLLNESGLRVASGMYLAIVSSPKFGEKVLKFAIILPQKQIQKY